MNDTRAEAQPGSRKSGLLARNVLVTLATQMGSWVLTFVVTLHLPRYIGAAGLGKLAFATSFVAMFGVVVPLGTGTVLVKEIARDRSRTGELVMAAGALRIILGLVMAGLVTALANLLGYPGVTRVLVALSAISMVVGTLNDTLGSALQGQERLPRQNLAMIVEKCLSSALTLALIFHRAPLWTLGAVGGFSGICSIVMNFSALRAFCPRLSWPSAATVRYVAMAGMPFVGWTIFKTLYVQCDPVVLSFVTNDATVGWYAAAARLTGSAYFLPVALTTAVFPTMARLHRDSPGDLYRLARRMFALYMLCGVPIALILTLVPERLLALLHFPDDFRHSIGVLRIGGVGVLLNFVGHLLGATIAASDRQAKMVRVSFLACLLGIPACIIGSYAGHRFWGNGAVGAILSDVALESYLVWSYMRILPSQILNRASLSLIVRCLLAAVPMAIWLCLTPVRKLGLWAVPPCLPIYLAFCWILRCLDPECLGLLRSLLRRSGAQRPTRNVRSEEGVASAVASAPRDAALACEGGDYEQAGGEGSGGSERLSAKHLGGRDGESDPLVSGRSLR